MVITLIVTAVVIIGILGYYFLKARQTAEISKAYGNWTFDTLSEEILQRLTDMTTVRIHNAYSDRLAKSLREKQKAVRQALDEVSYGIPKNIDYLQAVMQSSLSEILPTVEACKEVLDFDDWRYLIPNFQWELLLYKAEKEAPSRRTYFTWLFTKFEWDKEFMYYDPYLDREIMRRIVTLDRMQEALDYFMVEPLEYNDYMNLITRCIYNYKLGCGCIQQLRLTNVDGFNFGTSGSIRYLIEENFDAPYTLINSLWVQVNAGWIHLPFIDFGSQAEIARCIMQLSSWGNLASLTEKNAIKVNDAYDGARITAIRPPVGECWGCFVRKFSAASYTLEALLNHHGVKNWELIRDDIKWKMRGEQTTGFTGQQNTGKTSLMKAAMEEVRMVNIRVLEMSFELALRELYPWLNVFTIKPTEYVSETAAQDVLKKTDAYLSLVGEVATAIVAARMIQFCRVASAFTLFSYHAKTDQDYIIALATQLFQSGEYDSMEIATRDVLEVIKHNVHLDFVGGYRRIAFVSEIEKLDDIQPYPSVDELMKVYKDKYPKLSDDAIATLVNAEISREFYTRTTDRVKFTSRHTIEYNPKTNAYETRQGYTPATLKSILSHLSSAEKKEFIEWYSTNWGLNAKEAEA